MAKFRFSLDAVVVSHPRNWRDIEIVYERDEKIKGWFVKYTTQFEWVGDAYAAIKTAFDLDICDTMDFLLERRCSRFESWTTVFEGVIILEDIKWSEDYMCKIDSVVELNECLDDFIDYLEKDFDINTDGTKSYTKEPGSPGSALTSPIEDIKDWPIYGTSPPLFWAIHSFPVYNDVQQGAKIETVLSNMIRWMTDDCMDLESDFFTTDRVPTIIRFDVTSAPANGDFISLEVRDAFNDTYKYEMEVDATWIATWEKVLSLSETIEVPTRVFTDAFNVTHATVTTTERFEIYYYGEMEIVSSSFGTGAGTVTIEQDYVYGGNQLFIASGLMLQGKSPDEVGSGSLNFVQLFEYLTSRFDLGIVFEDVAGDWKVKIEPISDILSSSSSVTIRGVKNISREVIKDNIFIRADVGRVNAQYTYYHPFRNPSRIVQISNQELSEFDWACGVQDRTSDGSFYSGYGAKIDDIINTNTDDQFAKDWTMLEVYNSGPVKAFPFNYRFYDATVLNAFAEVNVYNVPYIPQMLYLNHKFTLPERVMAAPTEYENTWTPGGGFGFSANATGGTQTIAAGAGYSSEDIIFDKFISNTDFDLIINVQKITYNPGTNPANDELGFIKKVSHNIYSGMTHFELEST